MKLANISLATALVLSGVFAVGCTAKADAEDDDSATLATSEAQLVEDDDEASALDEDVETNLEEPLSGSQPTDPGTPAEGASDDELVTKVRTNPGVFFTPGCITNTASGNVVTHTFNNCSKIGDSDFKPINGTVTSTYVRENGKLTVTHAAQNLQINGATISGSRVIVYTRANGIIARTRTGAWTGTTAKGKSITHDANFTATWDASAKCVTRSGSASTTIGGRSLTRTITDYKRCGIGRLGCPESGKVTLTATGAQGSLSLTVEFTGGRGVNVTRPNGKVVTRQLVCIART